MGIIGSRIKREERIADIMIEMYCGGRHLRGEKLCADCRALADYAHERIRRCPFGDNKPACRRCPIHCYRPDMKEKIKQVMAYSGPKMAYKHPALAAAHILDG